MSCNWHATFACNAANEPTFMPTVCSCPEFMNWTHRVALRVINLSGSGSEQQLRRAMFKEFTPGPEWADGLLFLMTLAMDKQSKRPAHQTDDCAPGLQSQVCNI